MNSVFLEVVEKPHMRLVKNGKSTLKTERSKMQLGKIYINTLVPYFRYSNCDGKTIEPKNCALL